MVLYLVIRKGRHVTVNAIVPATVAKNLRSPKVSAKNKLEMTRQTIAHRDDCMSLFIHIPFFLFVFALCAAKNPNIAADRRMD
jgi:hypothetical protein